jgi:lipooligosaccharide transport system permease protein
MATPAAVRVLEHQLVSYRRLWKGSVVSSFLTPVLFLAAMGLGLGSYVDKGRGGAGAASLGSASYLVFLVPGLLAATAAEVAAIESTYPVMGGFKWQRHFHAAVATPIRSWDIVVGWLAWEGFRIFLTTTVFLGISVLFGAVRTPLAVLAIPAAVLTGLAFGAPITAYAATRTSDASFAGVLRFGVLPMFLFSGTFFPVSQLPAAVRPLAYVTPLWHGVDLCRRLALGGLSPQRALVHVAYLCAFVVGGALMASLTFARRLAQ